MKHVFGFFRHGRNQGIVSFSDLAKNKQTNHGLKGKGRCTKMSANCKSGKHSSCTSITCQCNCGHRGANRI